MKPDPQEFEVKNLKQGYRYDTEIFFSELGQHSALTTHYGTEGHH